MLGTNNSCNLERFVKILSQNGMNHENFRPWKFGVIRYIDELYVL